MAPLIEVTNEVLEGMNKLKIPYNQKDILKNKTISPFNKDDFIYVPSINLYVAKERTHLNKNWFDCHKLLQQNNQRMLIIPEFIEFLKYTKINFPDIYKDITEVRDPWRAEWLDADFEVKDKKLYINYNHILDSNGDLIPKNSEVLDKNTLMKHKTPGISLEDWLKFPTKQGFPKKNISDGDLYYWFPRSDNNSVARFDANSYVAFLNCNRIPSYTDSVLGVRAVRRE